MVGKVIEANAVRFQHNSRLIATGTHKNIPTRKTPHQGQITSHSENLHFPIENKILLIGIGGKHGACGIQCDTMSYGHRLKVEKTENPVKQEKQPCLCGEHTRFYIGTAGHHKEAGSGTAVLFYGEGQGFAMATGWVQLKQRLCCVVRFL